VIHPSWSAGGGSPTYCADDDPAKGAASIKVNDVASRTVRVLIAGGVNTSPVWSPDGQSLVFCRMVGDSNSEVFVADSGGANLRNITNSPAFASNRNGGANC
jgi:Tol biopolymer transport system component